MREYLDGNTLYSSLALLHAETASLYLVVEGPTDDLMLKPHCSSSLVVICATGGKAQALSAAELAWSRQLERVRFLVDRDYDDYREPLPEVPANVIASASHDCIVDIANAAPALLERVLEIETDSARRNPNRTKLVPEPSLLKQAGHELAAKLSAMRIVDASLSIGLQFRKFSFGALREEDFDVEKMAEMVLVRSGARSNPQADEWISRARSVHLHHSDAHHMVVGDHDLFAALARILKKYDIALSDESLRHGFFLATRCSHLHGTSWFREISDWCATHGVSGFSCAPLAA